MRNLGPNVQPRPQNGSTIQRKQHLQYFLSALGPKEGFGELSAKPILHCDALNSCTHETVNWTIFRITLAARIVRIVTCEGTGTQRLVDPCNWAAKCDQTFEVNGLEWGVCYRACGEIYLASRDFLLALGITCRFLYMRLISST